MRVLLKAGTRSALPTLGAFVRLPAGLFQCRQIAEVTFSDLAGEPEGVEFAAGLWSVPEEPTRVRPDEAGMSAAIAALREYPLTAQATPMLASAIAASVVQAYLREIERGDGD